jgi:redox-sensing transcriptional repressor
VARGLGLGEVQVRKDLAAVSGAGKPRVGYVTEELIEQIEECLGGNRLTPAVLVGAGKLGRALLEFDGFEEYGVRIVAGFDCNTAPLQIGSPSKLILPIRDLDAYCAEHHVKLGIITVGQGSAQDVCDRLVAGGIEAIWNFAPCTLKVPAGIILKQENLALSLAHLNNQLCKSFF